MTINENEYHYEYSTYVPIAVRAITGENNGGVNHTHVLLRGYRIANNTTLYIYVRNPSTKAANFRHYADILYVKG